MSEPLSHQRRYQQRMKAADRCIICGRGRRGSHYRTRCERCGKRDTQRHRKANGLVEGQ